MKDAADRCNVGDTAIIHTSIQYIHLDMMNIGGAVITSSLPRPHVYLYSAPPSLPSHLPPLPPHSPFSVREPLPFLSSFLPSIR